MLFNVHKIGDCSRTGGLRAPGVLLLLAATLSACSGSAPLGPGVLVDAEWVAEHRDNPDVVVLHVGMAMRDPERIPGSHLLEYHDIAVERDGLVTELAPVEDLVAAFRAAGVSSDSHVLLVGSGNPMHFPARAFMTLDYLGHGEHVSVLDGGIVAWKAAGGEVTTMAPPAPVLGDFEARPRDDMLVSAEWIAERLGDSAVVLVDARPEAEYTGEVPGRDFLRGGHIPGAYNLYWEDLVGDGVPTLIEENAVRARFAEAGPAEDGVVVNYCLIGMRASYTYMVSRHLGYDAKFYDASWNDWGAREDLPLVAGKEPS